MVNFLKKHATKLNTIALIFMLGIPFLLYMGASQGSAIQVKVYLGLMVVTMMMVMRKD